MPRISRRRFLGTTAAAAVVVTAGSSGIAASRTTHPTPSLTVADLPRGSAPQPLAFDHFPSRLHAFVWRNWQLVPTQRMAEVVGARNSDIVRIGRAMGLGKPPRIARHQQVRSPLTVIRRNWHLLPYEQILTLLNWTPDQLAFTLREDDVLFIKLGSLKPDCPPLRYRAPDAATLRREEEIAEIVAAEFPGALDLAEPLFDFVSRLSAPPKRGDIPSPLTGESLRFCFSYFALTGDPLLEKDADPYPEGLLARLSQAGVNGVWLHTPLYKISPFPWDPRRSEHYSERLENLRRLVARARRHSIRVLVYLNEPRGLPLAFFERYPHLKGVTEGDHAALCTSVPEVQQYLVDSVASVCRAVPDLGGFFSITFSENLTHCWSHNGGKGCPRCSQRPPAEVLGEVNPLFWKGIQLAGTGARLIAWDWGWPSDWVPEAIRQLPAEVPLMSVSEWSLPIERGGVKSDVGEYSISAVGPGPRARRHWRLARDRGLKTLAKIQAGNTWELSTVPYIPAVENVARHAENLRESRVDGLMLGWTLGGYPSPNLEVVAEVMAGATASEGLQRVAERRFGRQLAAAVVEAWRGYSEAFREFPYHIGVCYTGPQQLGPANPLWAQPTGYKATMVGFPYDDLDGWRAIYPPETFASQFERMAAGFESNLHTLRQAHSQAKGVAAEQHQALERECGVAEAAAIHFRSCSNQTRFLLARAAFLAAKTPSEAAPFRATLVKLAQAEIELARRLFRLQTRDSRLGFEASNQYSYIPVDLMEKVLNCRHLLEGWEKE
ncbi:MAG: twin-arginine translocation signal domain-containing protein [Verrucomicrobiales bacterium]|nr:twin-arginine translocation signal domain-containing protein [Verrucomicrobiales bacterium]